VNFAVTATRPDVRPNDSAQLPHAGRVTHPAPLVKAAAGPGGAESGLVQLVLRPAPRREPPFDDELDPAGTPPLRDQPLLPFLVPTPRLRRTVPHHDRPRELPDPAGWARKLLVGIIEAAAGRRPLQQLAGALSRGVAAGLGADLERAARGHVPHWTHAARVQSVRASEPARGVAEISATLRTAARVHAVAMRLEARGGRWCCTRLQLG
jgi:hypothetical protein